MNYNKTWEHKIKRVIGNACVTINFECPRCKHRWLEVMDAGVPYMRTCSACGNMFRVSIRKVV